VHSGGRISSNSSSTCTSRSCTASRRRAHSLERRPDGPHWRRSTGTDGLNCWYYWYCRYRTATAVATAPQSSIELRRGQTALVAARRPRARAREESRRVVSGIKALTAAVAVTVAIPRPGAATSAAPALRDVLLRVIHVERGGGGHVVHAVGEPRGRRGGRTGGG
jgi:hypothetical protein